MEHYKPLITGWKADIIKYAKQIEEMMHEFAVKTIADDPELTYQQAVNMFFCLREAEKLKSEFNSQEAADIRYYHEHKDEIKERYYPF